MQLNPCLNSGEYLSPSPNRPERGGDYPKTMKTIMAHNSTTKYTRTTIGGGLFAAPGPWYFNDPDNRKKEPTGPHCCRCMKPLTGAIGWTKVELHSDIDAPWVRINPLGEQQMGLDCKNIIFVPDNIVPNEMLIESGDLKV